MSCTRSEAALRLIAAYTNRVIDDPDFVGITLADYLAPDIITIVAGRLAFFLRAENPLAAAFALAKLPRVRFW
jgi:hypothetical protein